MVAQPEDLGKVEGRVEGVVQCGGRLFSLFLGAPVEPGDRGRERYPARIDGQNRRTVPAHDDGP